MLAPPGGKRMAVCDSEQWMEASDVTIANLTPRLGKQTLVFGLSLALLFAAWPRNLWASQYPDAPASQQTAQLPQVPPYTQETPEQLQQLVAPIALYPDSLVSQILAASTFPEQVVEADRWVQAHPDLKGDALGQAVNQQAWDPSVKALTAFPSVLGNMDKNLSWTSSLGDAYYNQRPEVMDAIQVMRQRAQAAGTLKTTSQQTVTTQDPTIVIEPADPEVVYVPAYDPWVVYGDPLVAWPGWYPYPGIWYGDPYLWFGAGFEIGWFGGFGWGWNHWGCDWHNRTVIYNHNQYYSRSNTFYNRSNYYRGGAERGEVNSGHGEVNSGHGEANSGRDAVFGNIRAGNRPSDSSVGERSETYNHPSEAVRPFDGDAQAARGYAEPRGQSGIRSDTFSGYDHGGEERGFSSRGGASFGGGGGFHGGGGGGGFHGGGGHR
jgi:Protein of unknown function (DUF3300)